jgi:5-methylcytosine-specific restriction endonuclease McrA
MNENRKLPKFDTNIIPDYDQMSSNKKRNARRRYMRKDPIFGSIIRLRDKKERSKFNSIKYRKRYMSEYNQQPENIERRNQLQRKKYHENHTFRLASMVRLRIYKCLKGIRTDKSKSVEQILGYSINTLKLHLESQFDDKMTWDNYGSYWVVDHIIPLISFEYTDENDEEFKKCWALTNLQPLTDAENNKKSDKLPDGLLARHKK